MRYLLDTNVVSELRKSPERINPGVVQWVRSVFVGDLYLSAITIYELELGVRRMEHSDPVQGAALRRWLTESVLKQFAGRILPFDAGAATLAAALSVPNKKPQADSYIAAIALQNQLTVVTRNDRDFQPMNVNLVNPFS